MEWIPGSVECEKVLKTRFWVGRHDEEIRRIMVNEAELPYNRTSQYRPDEEDEYWGVSEADNYGQDGTRLQDTNTDSLGDDDIDGLDEEE